MIVLEVSVAIVATMALLYGELKLLQKF